jgi:hypothetical protein
LVFCLFFVLFGLRILRVGYSPQTVFSSANTVGRDSCAKIPPPPKEVLPRREDFAVGDKVSFEGRDLIRKLGKIARINQKTASIVCEDRREWRVSFALLQRVINI